MCDAFFISAFIDELNKIGYDAACVKKASDAKVEKALVAIDLAK